MFFASLASSLTQSLSQEILLSPRKSQTPSTILCSRMMSIQRATLNVGLLVMEFKLIGFYFKVVSNFSKDTDIRFNIVNLYKSKSLYQQGMRILCLD
jgi:hypothetical protein